LRKPVYYINKYHKSNYQHLLKIIGPDKPDLNASSYILASIGIMNHTEGAIKEIEAQYRASGINFNDLLEQLGNNDADRALIKLAANLYDSSNDANASETFAALDDIYQAVAYQALMLIYPSFSKTWDSRYPYNREED